MLWYLFNLYTRGHRLRVFNNQASKPGGGEIFRTRPDRP